MIHKIAWIMIAGALGTFARYGVSGLIYKITGTSFPWGTIVVNILGCFLAGFIWTIFEERLLVAGELRVFVLVGFLGAFTSFSTLMLETIELLRSGEFVYVFINLAIQNGLGLAFALVGMAVGRIIV